MAINGSIPPIIPDAGLKKRRPSNRLSNGPFSNGISFSKNRNPICGNSGTQFQSIMTATKRDFLTGVPTTTLSGKNEVDLFLHTSSRIFLELCFHKTE